MNGCGLKIYIYIYPYTIFYVLSAHHPNFSNEGMLVVRARARARARVSAQCIENFPETTFMQLPCGY